MIDLKKTLVDLASAIVDHPEEVSVTETVDGDAVTLVLKVAEGDMGMVIGRHGRIARSLRTLMKSAANADGKKITIEIQ